MKLAHVFFGALPIGCGFWYKNGWHIKTDEEKAYCVLGKRWVFEGHHGCVITKDLAIALNIPEDSYRREQPLTGALLGLLPNFAPIPRQDDFRQAVGVPGGKKEGSGGQSGGVRLSVKPTLRSWRNSRSERS